MKQGFYLAPNVYVNAAGEVYALVNQGAAGMSGVDWEKIGDFAGDMFDKVIKFKQGSSQQQQQLAAQQQALIQAQMQRSSNPLSEIGGLSMPMLLILGLVGVVLFMKK